MEAISLRVWIFIAMFTELRHFARHASQSSQVERLLPPAMAAMVCAASASFAYCTAYMCDRISCGMSTLSGQSAMHWPHCRQNCLGYKTSVGEKIPFRGRVCKI